jgi:hypothetical protein
LDSENGSNGAAGADTWHIARRVQGDMRGRGCQATQQVKDQVTDMAYDSLDIIAKDPQIKHVAD